VIARYNLGRIVGPGAYPHVPVNDALIIYPASGVLVVEEDVHKQQVGSHALSDNLSSHSRVCPAKDHGENFRLFQPYKAYFFFFNSEPCFWSSTDQRTYRNLH
jgi:hypothetical protein